MSCFTRKELWYAWVSSPIFLHTLDEIPLNFSLKDFVLATTDSDCLHFCRLEGPQFSTRAESLLYCSWQASCVSMTCLPEAKLAREAEMCYALICMSTDYDSWHATNETVSVDMVMGHMKANVENAGRVATAVLDCLGGDQTENLVVREGRLWQGQTAFAAGITKEEGRDKETIAKLAWLLPETFGGGETGN